MTRRKLFWRGLQALTALTGMAAGVALTLILAWLVSGAPISYSGTTADGGTFMACGGSLFRQDNWFLTLLDLITVPSAIVTACVWLFRFGSRRL